MSLEMKDLRGGTGGSSEVIAPSEAGAGFGIFAEQGNSRLSSSVNLESLIRPSNCPSNTVDEVVRKINAQHSCCATSNSWCGHLVDQGCIGLLSHRGRIEACKEGRWMTFYHRATWSRDARLRDDITQVDNLTLVRVRRGDIGLAWDNGNPVFLAEGLHCYNDAIFKFDKSVNMNTTHIAHGTLHILRVPKGEYALVSEGKDGGLQPKILSEGLHVADTALFTFHRTVSVASPHISHGNLHVIQVEKGWVAKAYDNQIPYLLGEGRHERDSVTFEFKSMANLNEDLIKHGTITRFRVRKGMIALAWDENEPLLQQIPGDYQFDTPSFQFHKFMDAQERLIELGSRKIVTVQSGEVGVTYEGGALKVLDPGRHLIEKAEHRIHSFFSTQQRSIRLKYLDANSSVSAAAKGPDADLLVCETKDFVKVGVRADVFYSISDPTKCIISVGVEESEPLVRETSIATLTNIIRSTALAEMAQSKQPHAVSEEELQKNRESAQAMGGSSAPLFFDRAHDAFLAKLHDDFLTRYGMNISNIRIESFKIMDQSLADSISKQAVVTAQTQSNLANLQGETEIATATQERNASVQKIEAEARARVLEMNTNAENTADISRAEAKAKAKQINLEVEAEAQSNALLSKAKAEAEAVKIKADANAHSTRAQAGAEAEKIKVVSEAEFKRAELLNKTQIGQQLALLDTYKDMVVASSEGIEKVVYCDPSLARACNPLNMMSISGMGADLASLEGINRAGK